MKDKLNDNQVEAILKALDEAIETGPWEESNFLRVIGKNLRQIRENFVALVNNQGPTAKLSASLSKEARTGHQEVFISLYSSEGNNLQSWERILANLPRQMISRPIYDNEEGVQQLIKSKENKINEAYVVAYINQSDILMMAADKIPLDKFGKPLLSLKDRSLLLDNIIRFVHFSGTYHYAKGRLVKA